MKKTWIKNNECMVKGCTNKKHEGNFVGDMCAPCYKTITTGIIGPGTSFINDLYCDIREITRWIEKTFNMVKKYHTS